MDCTSLESKYASLLSTVHASHSTVTSSVQPQSTTDFCRSAPSQELSVSGNESQPTQSPNLSKENSSHSGANSPATNSQQCLNLRFECGCDQCSVYDHIRGKICPNQRELPFPKLGESPISSVDIDLIEELLIKRTRSIHGDFCILVFDTFKDLKKATEVTELISFLKALLKSKWYSQCRQSASKSIDVLEAVEPSGLPGYLIDNYCSWFDYDLIELLRKRYLFPSGADEDKALSHYKECLRCYVSQRCFMHFDTVPLSKNHTKVKCKIDSQYDKLSPELITHLKCVFTNMIGESKYSLVFIKAKRGCTELTFGAPPYFSEISKLSKYQLSHLKAHGFIQVTINGRILLQNKGSGRVSLQFSHVKF